MNRVAFKLQETLTSLEQLQLVGTIGMGGSNNGSYFCSQLPPSNQLNDIAVPYIVVNSVVYSPLL